MKKSIILISSLTLMAGCQAHPKISDLSLEAAPGKPKNVSLINRVDDPGTPNEAKVVGSLDILAFEDDIVSTRLMLASTTKIKDITTTYRADFDCKKGLYRPLDGSTVFKVHGRDGAKTEAPLQFNRQWSVPDKKDELLQKAISAVCYSE
jgi:hypothetical protein